MPPFELVIFDCDGVLVDTEPVANAVLKRELDAIGLEMPLEEVIRTFVGRSRADCLDIAARLHGGALPEGFGEAWDRAFNEALERETRAIEGIPELLRDFPLPYCVASNGEPERMRLALRAAGLLPLVEGRLFTASEVERPKPAPDLFLHAARSMGAKAARTVVVEDTVTGVTAGVAAGMDVLAYAGASHADIDSLRAAGARVFSAMRELPGLLGL
ncbi:MAG TPA: HAD family hydrolase [Usitatibacter sp.]|nr:HAD family hydrolase [Usitatibacter sp.]